MKSNTFWLCTAVSTFTGNWWSVISCLLLITVYTSFTFVYCGAFWWAFMLLKQTALSTTTCSFQGCIKGYHEYKDIWDAVVEVLDCEVRPYVWRMWLVFIKWMMSHMFLQHKLITHTKLMLLLLSKFNARKGTKRSWVMCHWHFHVCFTCF